MKSLRKHVVSYSVETAILVVGVVAIGHRSSIYGRRLPHDSDDDSDDVGQIAGPTPTAY